VSKHCPVCGVEVQPTAVQLKYGTYMCGPCRKSYTRRWQREHRGHISKRMNEWRRRNISSEEFREKQRLRREKWRRNNPDRVVRSRKKYPQKSWARSQLYWAVKGGKINRPTHCSGCGTIDLKTHNGKSALHGHHYRGYKFPLKVKWLCSTCHGKEHRESSK